MASPAKVVYVGSIGRFTLPSSHSYFWKSLAPVRTGTLEALSVYMVVLSEQSKRFSEGAILAQAKKIIQTKISLKEITLKYQTINAGNKKYLIAEYWKTEQYTKLVKEQRLVLARKDIDARLKDFLIRSNGFSDETVKPLTNLIKYYADEDPEFLEEYRPYLAALDNNQFGFSPKDNSLVFTASKKKVNEIKRWVTDRGYSFTETPLTLWDIKYQYYLSNVNNSIRHFIGASSIKIKAEPKRLVAVKLKLPMWQAEN